MFKWFEGRGWLENYRILEYTGRHHAPQTKGIKGTVSVDLGDLARAGHFPTFSSRSVNG